MKILRLGLTIGTVLFLVVGYAASQIAYFNGTASKHALQMDSVPVRLFATAVMILAIVLAANPEKEANT